MPRTSSIGLVASASRSENSARSPSGAMTSAGTGPAEPNAARISSRSRSTASAREQTAITMAFRGPTFMKVCRLPDGVSVTATISSSSASAFRFGPTRNSASGTVRRGAGLGQLDLGALDQEGRQRVTRGRGGAEVAADRAAVSNLRRADRARGLGQRRLELGELALHRLGVRQPGSEPQRAVLARPAAQLGDLVEVQDRLRTRTVEVELDHDVGAALDGFRVGSLGLQRERFVQRPRG